MLFVVVYANSFSVSVNVYLLHPIIVLSLYVLIFFISPKRIWVFIGATTTFLLLLHYTCLIIAAIFWNESVSISFLLHNYDVFITEGRKFAFVIVIPLLIIAVLLAWLYKKLTPSVDHRMAAFGILPILPLTMFGFYHLSQVLVEDLDSIWQGEPVYELFKFNPIAKYDQSVIHSPMKEASVQQRAKPNIILIHADALRADRLGLYDNPRNVSPFIDNLIKKQGTIFKHSFSNCSESICGVSSVLTSTFSYQSANYNLVEILKEAGYFTTFIGTGDLNHAALNRFFEPKLDNFLRADLDNGYYKHDDRFILDIIKKFPESKNVPYFFYIRMMSTHGLGSHKEEFKRYGPTPDSLLSIAFGGDSKEQLINDRDNRVIQFDAYLNAVYSELTKKGYLDNAIIVIFGDHGDAFGEHGLYGHYHSLYNEEINVPILFWHSDNIDLELNEQQFATLMDVPPTLLHHLGMPLPTQFLGKALQLSPTNKLAFLDDRRGSKGNLLEYQGSLYKWFTLGKEQQLLFNLTVDWEEKNNIYQQQPELVKQIKKEVRVSNP